MSGNLAKVVLPLSVKPRFELKPADSKVTMDNCMAGENTAIYKSPCVFKLKVRLPIQTRGTILFPDTSIFPHQPLLSSLLISPAGNIKIPSFE